MDLATRKYNFIRALTTVDETILSKLEKVLNANQQENDWYLNLSNEEKKELEVGVQQANDDEVVSHEEVMKKFSKWH